MADFSSVVVTDKAVLFDGMELPCHIAQGGISFKPGGSDDINRLTVEFLVGPVVFTDPTVEAEVAGEDYDESERRWNTLAFWIFAEWRMATDRIDKLTKEFHSGRSIVL